MKFLIVGLGSMGKRRIRNLKRAGIKDADIVGFDLKGERRAEAETTYNVKTVDTFEKGMATNPTGLVISTPPNLHMGYAKSGVEAGKHFFAEAGTSPDGLLEVAALAKKHKVVAAPSCTLRFQPSIAMMKDLIGQGRIGKVLTFTHHCGQWLPDWHPAEDYRTFYVSRRETGACREIVPFELTWLNWLVGAKATRVAGMKAKLSKLDCDIDDVYQLLIGYDSGVIGHLQVDVLARAPVRHVRIIGEEGTLEWSIMAKKLEFYEVKTGKWTTFAEPAPRIEKGYSEMSNEAMYDAEIAAYLAAIKGEKPWGNSLEDDHATLELLLASEQSNDKNIIAKPGAKA
jgi:predicted dehydrogenase